MNLQKKAEQNKKAVTSKGNEFNNYLNIDFKIK